MGDPQRYWLPIPVPSCIPLAYQTQFFPASLRDDGFPASKFPAELELPEETEASNSSEKEHNTYLQNPTALFHPQLQDLSHYSCKTVGKTRQVTTHNHLFGFQNCHHPDLDNMSDLK